MTTVIYDGSFEGLLCAIFDIYEYKFQQVDIVSEAKFQPSLLSITHRAYLDNKKQKRVWNGLRQRLSAKALDQLYRSFLSEEKGIENIILSYVQKVFASKTNIENAYADKDVLYLSQTAKKVYREKHRMEAFVRFQLTKDKLYYATCQPDFNVLPLLINHFEKRYADQRWLIYDSLRKYGIYYNLETVEYVELNFSEEAKTDPALILDEKEIVFQQLWQQYFTSVNIVARKNMKLHIKHMPKRYWKFLPEKAP